MDRREFIKALLSLTGITWLLEKSLYASDRPNRKTLLIQNSPIAGCQYYDGETIWDQIRVHDTLELVREPNNPHDDMAIEVFWDGKKLGYVPRTDNRVVSQMMDRNNEFVAKISNKKRSNNPWERLEMGIYLLT